MSDLSRLIGRLLLLPSFIIAIGVMIKGYADVGDGFSAGVIASLGVAMQLTNIARDIGERDELAARNPRSRSTRHLIAHLVEGEIVGVVSCAWLRRG